MAFLLGPQPAIVATAPQNGVIYDTATGKIVSVVWGTTGPVLQSGQAFLAVASAAALMVLQAGIAVPPAGGGG